MGVESLYFREISFLNLWDLETLWYILEPPLTCRRNIYKGDHGPKDGSGSQTWELINSLTPNPLIIKVFRCLENGIHHPLLPHRKESEVGVSPTENSFRVVSFVRTCGRGLVAMMWNSISKEGAYLSLLSFGGAELSFFLFPHPPKPPIQLPLGLSVYYVRPLWHWSNS